MTPSQLKQHLKRVRIGQMEAARRLKVNPRTVRRWVAGDSPIPEAVAQLVTLWPTGRQRPDRRP
jgi:DNA-binding transcriptional regulator YiaG